MISDHSLQDKIEKIANLGSYEVDMSTGLWEGSEQFISIFGLPKKKQYTQEDFQSLIHPEDYEEVMAYFGQCLANQEDFNYEYRCILPSGKIIHVMSRSHVEYKEDGTPLRVIGIKQDITARKEAELHINTLNELNKKKTEVMGMVAHDLRSPLAQIVGLVEILQDQIKGKEPQEYLKLIYEACMSSSDIITDLIDISELNNQLNKPNLTQTDINEIIEATVSRHQLALKKKDQQVNTNLADTAKAYVDKVKFTRVIDNLLTNAIKFSPHNEIITLRTEQVNGNLIIKVEDNGIGIKSEHTHLLFSDDKSLIRRVGTAGERSTGLGLTIVKQIVELHGGHIEVKSSENEGTTFSVILPNKPVSKEEN